MKGVGSSWGRAPIAALVALAPFTIPQRAQADETSLSAPSIALSPAPNVSPSPPPITMSFIVGSTMLLGGLAVGSHMMAEGGPGNRGLFVAHIGFASAPLATHLLVGEGMRGLFLTMVPAATAVASELMLESRPRVQVGGKAADRTVYETLFIIGLSTGVLGVVDVLGAKARVPKTNLFVSPSANGGGYGFSISGAM